MITFFPNFINDYQIPFYDAMYEKTNGEFRFMTTIKFDLLRFGKY